MKNLTIASKSESKSIINNDGILVGEIILDYRAQTKTVLVCGPASTEERLAILRLATSHACQYLVDRQTFAFGGLITVNHADRSLTRADSERLMDFARIPPQIASASEEVLIQQLSEFSIKVLDLVHESFVDAMNEIFISQPGCQWELLNKGTWRNDLVHVKLTAPKSQKFTFWTAADKPRPEGAFDLHLVPDYHPVMKDKESSHMINGATNALIRSDVIDSVYAPDDSRTSDESFGTTWNHVEHPFYATGKTFELTVDTSHARTQSGIEELQIFLASVLGGDSYVCVSGGFRAPMKCAHNRLLEIGRLNDSPWPQASRDHRKGHVARGSEEKCVWEYRTLQEEGALDKAYVPDWFLKEDWLGIYETAEVQPGLF